MFDYMSTNVGHVAALLISFRGLLRKCQLTASDSNLLRRDIKFFSWEMLITVKKTKTIQFKQRELVIPIAKFANKRLCTFLGVSQHF